MLTESFLRNYRAQTTMYKSFSESNARKTVFLSHSHKDKDLVEGFINYLADSAQITIYVDWQDSDMPNEISRKTAERIKSKIHDLDFFLVLATQNAMNSKWVPWEIGIADQLKLLSEIAIIPVAGSDGKYPGNEYLQLYSSILLAPSNTLAKFEVGQLTGKSVRSWFIE